VNEWTGDITLDQLYCDHPAWVAWRGNDGLWYAMLRGDPGIVAHPTVKRIPGWR
jgi:hypothetical protein